MNLLTHKGLENHPWAGVNGCRQILRSSLSILECLHGSLSSCQTSVQNDHWLKTVPGLVLIGIATVGTILYILWNVPAGNSASSNHLSKKTTSADEPLEP